MMALAPCLMHCTYMYSLRVERPPRMLIFNSRIEPALFVYDKNVKLWGACNKLCNPPKWPFTGSSKRDGVHYQPVRRGEKVIDPSSTDMVATDNCTETQVTPTAGWANYAPTKDFVTAHGHYIVRWTPNPQRPTPKRHPSSSHLCLALIWQLSRQLV